MTATEALRKKVKEYVETADSKSLKMVQDILLRGRDYDWWNELPDNVKVMIEDAIKEGDAGMGMPHEEVLAKYSKWFKK